MEFRNLVFIVGAGASKEFDFPIGADLVKDISSICNITSDDFGRLNSGNGLIRDLMLHKESLDGRIWNPSYLARQAQEIRENMGLAPSIDNYLDAHRDNLERVWVGKLAIAEAIRAAERKSNLFVDTSNANNRLSFSSLPDNWLSELFRVLVAEQDMMSFVANLKKCRFVCFNYDRVIEQFFFYAISSYFELSKPKAIEICQDNLNIVHVYGSAGELDFQQHNPGFDKHSHRLDLAQSAAGIRTFTEGVNDELLVAEIRDAIETSDLCVFLGFAFHPLNIEALRAEVEYSAKRVVGTSYGLSAENLSIALNEMRHRFFPVGTEFEFQPIKCVDLIRYHSAYLSGRG